MKAKYILGLIVALFLLTACGQAPEKTFNEKIADAINEAEVIGADYLGPWLRTATYVGGELTGTTPATLTFNKDGTYTSVSADCANSGTYTDNGESSITMVMLQSGCPGGLQLPFTVVYTYTIEENEDGNEIMTINTANVMETYIRQ